MYGARIFISPFFFFFFYHHPLSNTCSGEINLILDTLIGHIIAPRNTKTVFFGGIILYE